MIYRIYQWGEGFKLRAQLLLPGAIACLALDALSLLAFWAWPGTIESALPAKLLAAGAASLIAGQLGAWLLRDRLVPGHRQLRYYSLLCGISLAIAAAIIAFV